MWEQLKEHWWNWLGIFAWLFLFVHLILIKFYGSVLIYENIQIVLWIELIVAPLILILGIGREIRDWRRNGQTQSGKSR